MTSVILGTKLLLALAVLTASTTAGAMAFKPNLRAERDAPVTEVEHKYYERILADRVVVKKAERRLYLMKEDKPFRTYKVSLGTRPEGPKQEQGDGRTPEGRYFLDRRSTASKFRKSLHISYPNTNDRLQAQRRGVNPGDLIMIHGQPAPNRYRDLQEVIAGEDWTQGCIAVSNLAIDEIWDYTANGTPIDILP